MALYDDTQGKQLFNDGEGLTHGDLNEISTKLERKFWEQSMLGGMDLGRALFIDFNDAAGLDLFVAGPGNGSTSRAFCPFPYNGPVIFDDLDKLTWHQRIGAGVFGQRWSSNLTGSQPDGSSSVTIMRTMEDSEYDIGDDIKNNAAPGSGDPRWDTWGFLMGYDTGDSQTRDFEDATTRAKSTASQDKEMLIDVTWDYQLGPQSATFDMATLTANYVPYLTLRRPVGEGDPFDIDDVYYQAYPMRLGIEDIPGYELHFLGTEGSTWDEDTIGQASLEKISAATGTAYAIPRTMHDGCRLVGLGVISDGWLNDPYIKIGKFGYDSSGVATFSSIVDVGSAGGGAITSAAGFAGVGELDWSPSSTKLLPIWGNGMTSGPLFVPHRYDYGSAKTAFNKLAVEFSLDTSWAAGDRIKLVRFIYLY
jgi:hypothetical protein